MTLITWAAVAVSLVSSAYVLFAVDCLRVFALRLQSGGRRTANEAGITVLKPLCGPDAGLEENLRSFCRQDHDRFQVIFGVRDSHDPAIPVVGKILNEFPQLDLKLVVDDRVHGANLKVSNLLNMFPHARYDRIVIADSDMRVEPDYLAGIGQALAAEDIGMVTCLYVGRPLANLPSRLGAMFINEWFLPSVLVATRFVPNSFCFGATMAIHRQVLEAIGGLESLVDYLADDYMLGRKVIATGKRVDIAPLVVENIVYEPGWRDLIQHELRWARTMRTVQTAGYAGSFLSDAVPVSLICAIPLILIGESMIAAGLAVVALLVRCLLHLAVNKTFNRRQAVWLFPLRDLLTFLIRVTSFLGGDVEWRKQSLHVDNGSQLSVKE